MAEPQRKEESPAAVTELHPAQLPEELVDVPLGLLEPAAIIRSMRRHQSTTKVAKALGVSVRKIQYRVARYRRDGWL